MTSPLNLFRASLALVVLALAFSIAYGQDDYPSVKPWETFDFAAKGVSSSEISALASDDLKLVRGLVFGRHGRGCKDPGIRRVLQSRAWYKANPNFQDSALND